MKKLRGSFNYAGITGEDGYSLVSTGAGASAYIRSLEDLHFVNLFAVPKRYTFIVLHSV